MPAKGRLGEACAFVTWFRLCGSGPRTTSCPSMRHGCAGTRPPCRSEEAPICRPPNNCGEGPCAPGADSPSSSGPCKRAGRAPDRGLGGPGGVGWRQLNLLPEMLLGKEVSRVGGRRGKDLKGQCPAGACGVLDGPARLWRGVLGLAVATGGRPAVSGEGVGLTRRVLWQVIVRAEEGTCTNRVNRGPHGQHY